MDVRTHDDGGLPGGLSFSDADPELLPARRGSWLRGLAWLLVLAGILGAAGLVGASWVRDADVRSSLDSSTRIWSRSLGTLLYADDVVAISAAAAAAPSAAERVQRDLADLGSTIGTRRGAVAAQLAAEREVLLALAELQGVDRAPLAVWGDAHTRLSRAADAEAASRTALRAVDARAAGRLPDLRAVLLSVGATVGDALARNVTQSSAELLTALGAAGTTAELRAVADRATAQQEAVLVARSGIPSSDDGAVLDAFAEALDAVTGLQQLTAADTAGWPGARSRLDGALGRVADGGGSAPSLAASSVRAQLPVVLAGVDRVVQRAGDAHAAWLPVRAAAEQARADDEAALQVYGERVRALQPFWDRVQEALTTVQTDVQATGDERTADDVARVVRVLAAELARGRGALAGLTVPASAEQAHTELLGSVTSTGSAVREAGVLLADDRCAGCPATAAPGWSEFERVAEDDHAWDAAQARWEKAHAAALDEVATRALPPPPDA